MMSHRDGRLASRRTGLPVNSGARRRSRLALSVGALGGTPFRLTV
jgi:hypothetical protein